MSETKVVKDKLVFYSDVDIGMPQAKAFCAANDGYMYFQGIFNENFIEAFSLPEDEPLHSDVNRAASKAMAYWATADTRIFNHDGGVL